MTNRQTWALLAAFVGGAAWGSFWVPIRALERAGFAGFWSVAAIWGGVALIGLPFFIWRHRQVRRGGWRLQFAGAMLATAMACYSVAFLYTEVVSAVLLYYLSPVWGFVLAWLVMRDPITPVRWLAMALALAGAVILLGADSWPPHPANRGDWLALAAGLIWVIGSLLMLTRPEIDSIDYILSFFVWGGVISVIAAIITSGAAPSFEVFTGVAPWLSAAIMLMAAPGAFAALYGASILNPGLVGIIFMAEIGVSLVLAAILTDEPFGLREAIGVALIMAAGIAEWCWHTIRNRIHGA